MGEMIRDPPQERVRCHLYEMTHHTHERIPKMAAQELHDSQEGPRKHREHIYMCQSCGQCQQ